MEFILKSMICIRTHFYLFTAHIVTIVLLLTSLKLKSMDLLKKNSDLQWSKKIFIWVFSHFSLFSGRVSCRLSLDLTINLAMHLKRNIRRPSFSLSRSYLIFYQDSSTLDYPEEEISTVSWKIQWYSKQPSLNLEKLFSTFEVAQFICGESPVVSKGSKVISMTQIECYKRSIFSMFSSLIFQTLCSIRETMLKYTFSACFPLKGFP